MIRSFVALRPPEAVRDRLEDLALDLPEGRPVDWENLHLTLAFLGDRTAPALADAADELARIDAPAPEIRIEGLGVFGAARPRSAHAAVRPDPALTALRDAVRRAVRRGGIELPHERFVPHVTLVRFGPRTPAGEGLARWLAKHAAFACAPFTAAEAVLMRSDLGPEGPTYTELAAMELG